MTRFRLALVAIWCGTAVARAQSGDLIVQRNAEGLYLTHQVAPKENFYSIGRLFNISPKVLAPFNGLALNGGLSIGQELKIPLKDQNFTAVKKKDAPAEVLVPVYRMAEGKKVLAGYLKVNKGESPLASGGPAVSAPAGATGAVSPPVAAAKPLTDAGMQADATPAKPAPKQPAATKPVNTAKTATDAGMTAQATTDPGSTDPLATPTTTTAQPPASWKKKKPVPPPPAPETTAVAQNKPTLVPTHPAVPDVSTASSRYAGEGAFHPDYMTQTDEGRKTRSTSGLAGVFKSTSGWDNGKFYALMKGVERGTVVKVTNLTNNKVVFAKVLGDIADIKQNTGMLIVLSDAAVTQLGASTDRFTTTISYAK